MLLHGLLLLNLLLLGLRQQLDAAHLLNGFQRKVACDDLPKNFHHVAGEPLHLTLPLIEPHRDEIGLDLLSSGCFVGIGRAADDVRHARDFVQVVFDAIPSLVEMQQRLRDIQHRQQLHRALESALFCECRPLIDGDQLILDAFRQQPLQSGRAGICHACHLDRLCD